MSSGMVQSSTSFSSSSSSLLQSGLPSWFAITSALISSVLASVGLVSGDPLGLGLRLLDSSAGGMSSSGAGTVQSSTSSSSSSSILSSGEVSGNQVPENANVKVAI